MHTSARRRRSASPTKGVTASGSSGVIFLTCCSNERWVEEGQLESLLALQNALSGAEVQCSDVSSCICPTCSQHTSCKLQCRRGGSGLQMTSCSLGAFVHQHAKLASMVRMGSAMMGPLPAVMSKGMFTPLQAKSGNGTCRLVGSGNTLARGGVKGGVHAAAGRQGTNRRISSAARAKP